MCRYSTVLWSTVWIGVVGFVCFGADKNGQKEEGRLWIARPASTDPTGTNIQEHDDAEIRRTRDAYCAAFCKADAKKVTERFTENAEYIDAEGVVYHGRQKIEDLLTSRFVDNPNCQLEIEIGSIRIIGTGIAIEDGTTSLTLSKTSGPLLCRYTVVHQKMGGNWLTASVREKAATGAPRHKAEL